MKLKPNVGGKIAQVGSRLIDMTAKKMADIFFGNFSDLISSEKTSQKTNTKLENENKKMSVDDKISKIKDKKIIIFISAAILLGIAIYLIY
jgi:Uncharacterized conserved protein